MVKLNKIKILKNNGKKKKRKGPEEPTRWTWGPEEVDLPELGSCQVRDSRAHPRRRGGLDPSCGLELS